MTSAGSMAGSVEQPSSALPLYHGCPPVWILSMCMSHVMCCARSVLSIRHDLSTAFLINYYWQRIWCHFLNPLVSCSVVVGQEDCNNDRKKFKFDSSRCKVTAIFAISHRVSSVIAPLPVSQPDAACFSLSPVTSLITEHQAAQLCSVCLWNNNWADNVRGV